jgi:YcaO-like protein with predicted kinase domain
MNSSLFCFEAAFSADVPKAYWSGTHRTCDPAQTVSVALALAPRFGITRVANVTGLDTIGIPVVMVVRPNSRSLSVSQGKGVTTDAAKASALMESIELYHAEHIELPVKYCSQRVLREKHCVVDTSKLPRPNGAPFSENLPIIWIEGYDLVQREPIWLPYESVYFDCTIPLAPGYGSFLQSSNGLASGNNVLEALSHAISEVIERDATTLAAFSHRPLRRVDLTTVDDEDCLRILGHYQRNGIVVDVFDVTSDIGVPSFDCVIADPLRRATAHQHRAGGHGCHLDKNIALLRALTEAAQSRLTLIAGSRDDITRRSYQRGIDPWATAADELSGAPRDFRAIGSLPTDSMLEDVRMLLERLCSIGVERVIAINLTKPEFPLSVVKIVIPELEYSYTVPTFSPGARARALMKAEAA